jgi:hypothetical protein
MSRRFLVPVRPLHVHDCDDCILVGIEKGCDLYFCPGGSYIARRSDELDDYTSTPLEIVESLRERVSPLIWSAYQRHQVQMDMMTSFTCEFITSHGFTQTRK